MRASQVRLLWFMQPSLNADYGSFNCQQCGQLFYYSPRLNGCYCHTCALEWLNTQACTANTAKERERFQNLHDDLKRLTEEYP